MTRESRLHAFRYLCLASLILVLTASLGAAQDWGTAPGGPPPGGDRNSDNAIETVVSDPVGDTFGSGDPQHDIIEFSASYSGTDLFLSLTFNDPITPGDSGQPNAMVGAIDMDTDQNPATGTTSTVDMNCPQLSGLGSDFFLALFEYDSSTGQAPVYDTTTGPVGNVDVTFTATSASAIVPLSLLSDDGILDTATVIGTIPEPTDCAPNGGFITTSFGVPTVGIWALLLIAAVLTVLGLGLARRLRVS